MDRKDDKFPSNVSDREQRKLRARKEDKRIWFGLGMFGMVGWSVALPTVAAIFLGIWLDSSYPIRYSWTLMMLVAGLCLGCYNAWYWVQKERQELITRDKPDKKDD